jgi:hypothetical protein
MFLIQNTCDLKKNIQYTTQSTANQSSLTPSLPQTSLVKLHFYNVLTSSMWGNLKTV